MVTLSQFFLPAPDLATRMADALADEGVVVQAGGVKAPHIFGGPGWRMLSSAAVQHIAGLMDISFVNVLVGAWNKSFAVGQQIGDRAFFKMRQQFGERNTTEFLLEYQLADFLRLQTTAAPETSGSAFGFHVRVALYS